MACSRVDLHNPFPVGQGINGVIDEDSGKNERAGPQTPPFLFGEVCTDCEPRANDRYFRGKKGALLERC